MSDFYGNLKNPRMPEVVMNQGPLPPLSTDGMPYGLNGTADSRINYNNALLGGITPYSYGDAARLSTQTSYLNVPYRMQKIVPELFLPPMADGAGYVRVSHAVDYGDIAWAVRLRNISATLGVFMKSVEGVNDNGTHITAFINLPTLNYILVGFQNLWHKANQANRNEYRVTDSNRMWLQLWYDLNGYTGQPDGVFEWRDKYDLAKVVTTIIFLVTPFGVCAGSEKQGGMHEVGLSPVMWTVNHVTSMNIDGLTQDMINYWKYMDLNSGDKLCFRLGMFKLGGKSVECTLNHFYKKIVSVKYTPVEHNQGSDGESFYWLMIPDVYPYRFRHEGASAGVDTLAMHWFIGSTQQHYPKMYESVSDMSYFLDDRVFLKGSLLETTITPMLRNADMLLGENQNQNGDGGGNVHGRFLGGAFKLLSGVRAGACPLPFQLGEKASRRGGAPFALPAPVKRRKTVQIATADPVPEPVGKAAVAAAVPVVPEVAGAAKVAKQVAKPVGGGKVKKVDVV